MHDPLPIPPHFDPAKVSEVWRVPYETLAPAAAAWASEHRLAPAAEDSVRIILLPIDTQNTFCIPGFELFVGGRSGRGAVDDTTRLCRFIYRHLGVITQITPTMDTHMAMQIFHPIFWVNAAGEHPAPYSLISVDDVREGAWSVNPDVAWSVNGGEVEALQRFALHYTRRLAEGGKYDLTIWPYHAMLGGIGHALVSSLEEALFFHAVARQSQTSFEMKGDNPLTENYSVLKPEVLDGPDGEPIARPSAHFIEELLSFDMVIIAGQAKSHCMAWTIDDLLTEIVALNADLARKVYLLEDCTSPVVVPGVIDYTDAADSAFERFRSAGMHVVRSTDPVASWPGVPALVSSS